MPGRAQSQTSKRQEFIQTKDKWMDQAVDMYRRLNGEAAASANNNTGEGGDVEGPKSKGLRAVCEYLEERCWEEDEMRITLDKTTLKRRLEGVPSQAKSNAEWYSWLMDVEADALIEYALQLGREGWPFSAARIEEHANEICRGHYGEDFGSVGQNWVYRVSVC